MLSIKITCAALTVLAGYALAAPVPMNFHDILNPQHPTGPGNFKDILNPVRIRPSTPPNPVVPADPPPRSSSPIYRDSRLPQSPSQTSRLPLSHLALKLKDPCTEEDSNAWLGKRQKLRCATDNEGRHYRVTCQKVTARREVVRRAMEEETYVWLPGITSGALCKQIETCVENTRAVNLGGAYCTETCTQVGAIECYSKEPQSEEGYVGSQFRECEKTGLWSFQRKCLPRTIEQCYRFKNSLGIFMDKCLKTQEWKELYERKHN